MDNKSFYDELSSMYDVMFPYASQAARISFLDRIFTERGIKTVLDCGCGTGRQAIDLTLRGFKVVGSDVSPRMLELARQNAVSNGLDLEWIESDFSSLSSRVARTFGAVYCIGNSLPHVHDKNELYSALCSMRDTLDEGGVLVLHLRNYANVLREKTRLMPTLSGTQDGVKYIFQRIVDFLPDGRLSFSVLTLREVGPNQFVPMLKTTAQYPATKSELEEMLVSLGLIHVTSYGGFEHRDYDSTSENLVMVARKPPVEWQQNPV